MKLLDVLDAQDIAAFGQELRALLDGGYVSRAVAGILDGKRLRLAGTADKYMFDLSVWTEEKVHNAN